MDLPRRTSYRAVFISDLHLGSAGCRAHELSRFLESLECDYLYLVGDVLDGWVGGRATRWRPDHGRVLKTLLQMVSPGCMVRYMPGNHDSLLRRFNGFRVFNASIDHSFVHETLRGVRLLVVHGDMFDRFVTTFKPMAWGLAWVYEYVSRLNRVTDAVRRLFGYENLDFATRMKMRVKAVTERFTAFEDHLVAEARRQDCDGVVCGHVHHPRLYWRNDGMLYANTGDWVEHATALVEHLNGRLELLDLTTGVPLTLGEAVEYTPTVSGNLH